MKTFNIIILALILSLNLYSQDEKKSVKTKLDFNADIASRYIWRGMNAGGNSPFVHPCATYSISKEKHNISIIGWGAYSLSSNNQYQEVDFIIDYIYNNVLGITISDYFAHSAGTVQDIFNYNMDWNKINSGSKNQTSHMLACDLSFKGTSNNPFSLLFSINLWGADSRKYKNENGIEIPEDAIVMSKYFELGYKAKLKTTTANFFLGVALDKAEAKEQTGFYGQEKTSIVNLGFRLDKSVKITKEYSLPVNASLVVNPATEKIFMVFGITI